MSLKIWVQPLTPVTLTPCYNSLGSSLFSTSVNASTNVDTHVTIETSLWEDNGGSYTLYVTITSGNNNGTSAGSVDTSPFLASYVEIMNVSPNVSSTQIYSGNIGNIGYACV